MIYKTYDEKIEALIHPVINNACNCEIKHFDLENPLDEKSDRNADVTILTMLYQLYRLLSDFVQLGKIYCPRIIDDLKLKDFHVWFKNKDVQLVKTAIFKALIQIRNAIDLDNFEPNDECVKYSSSAVDTLTIFNQIIIYWKTFLWPDAEQSFVLIIKLAQDINKCCEFYAEKIFDRLDVEGLKHTEDEISKHQTKRCIAINNIDHICQTIHATIVNDLNFDGTIQEILSLRGPLCAQKCTETLKSFIEDFKSTSKKFLFKSIVKVARKMNPVMKRFLTDGANNFSKKPDSMNEIMNFLYESLEVFDLKLSKNDLNQLLEAIWIEIAGILNDLINQSLKKRRLPTLYAKLRQTLQSMLECFTYNNEQNNDNHLNTCNDTRIKKILDLLKLYACTTAELIYQYHLECHTIQQIMTDHPFGLLTIQCYFYENTLKIDIMNAKHLPPRTNNVKRNPFVQIRLKSENQQDKFPTNKLQSKIVRDTFFPIFDNSFSL